MPLPASKNTGLSPASADLGLGDLLAQQAQDETAEMRKKRMAQGQGAGHTASPAAMSLLGGGVDAGA